MTRVFIIGAGCGCKALLEYLTLFSWVEIVGVSDQSRTAADIGVAEKAGLPTYFTDPIEILKTQEVDIVFELTGESEMRTRLLELPDRHFGIATGDAIYLFINTISEARQQDHLLKKHMEISLMIAQSRSISQIFDTIVTGGMEITNMPVGSLALFDQEKEEFSVVSQKGLPMEMFQEEHYFIRPGGLTQLVLSSSKSTVISDLKECKTFDNEFLLNQGIRSLIAIPLLSEGNLLGILYYDDVKPRTYPHYLVDQLNQFATKAVIAIQKHKAISEVKHLSSRDTLTGLYSRSQMVGRLKEAIQVADKECCNIVLFICDLDSFKKINEKFGHQYGDQVVKTFADCLAFVMQDEKGTVMAPTLFRSGVDEVTVLLVNVTHEEILRKAQKIRKAVQDKSADIAFPLDVSIGVAIYPTECQSLDQMMTMAGHSLVIAKKSDQKMCIGATGFLHHPNPICTIFEPIVDVANNCLIGYEALSRDAHGNLPILELFKQYAALGQLSEIKSACFFSQIEMAEAMNLSRVFLNVDSLILHHCAWVKKPANIEVILEISEAEPLHDVEAYLKMTSRWKEKGFKFAIDDFGGGYVSLPFIAQLNPEYIKVDRSVVLQAVASPPFRTFLRSIMGALQKDHSIEIIAEGAETEEDIRVIGEVGIPLIQGFILKEKGFMPIFQRGESCPPKEPQAIPST